MERARGQLENLDPLRATPHMRPARRVNLGIVTIFCEENCPSAVYMQAQGGSERVLASESFFGG
jgi:hypothetical protein